MLPAAAQRGTDSIVWALGAEPRDLAAYLSVEPAAAQLGAKIYDGLLEYDAERRPRPGLAERWHVSLDGLSITFHLRSGVLFHDGKPFSSADVAFTILDVLRKSHPRGVAVFKHVSKIETPDPQTAILHLSEPAPYLLSALAAHESPMLPRHALTEGKPPASGGVRSSANPVVGTGPFKLASRMPGRGLTVVRNEKYWRAGLPRLARIDVRFVPSETERVALAERGEAHIAGNLDTETVHRMTSTGVARVRLNGADAHLPVVALSLNTTRPPFDKLEMRQAVALAFDRAALAASVWHGFAQPAQGPIPAELLGPTARHAAVIPAVAPAGDALEQANHLLDLAGAYRREDGVRMTLVHDVAPLGPEWQRLSEAVELQLAKVGIKVASRFETIEAWMRRIAAGDDVTMSSHLSHGFSDPAIALHRTLHSAASEHPSPFANSARWHEPEADRLMDLAMGERDPVSRSHHYRNLQDLAVKSAPYVWLVEPTPPVLVHRDLHRAMVAPLGLYGNFAEAHFVDQSAAAASHASRSTVAQSTSTRPNRP